MIYDEEFLALKVANAKLERDNLRLKNEIYQLTEINEQILPLKTFLIDKYKEQEKEKDAKIMSLESIISSLRDQKLDKREINKKDSNLLQQKQKLKETIISINMKYKPKEDEFSEKRRQDENDINNLKTILPKTPQPNTSNDNNKIIKIDNQLNTALQILSRKYKSLKIKSKFRILELNQLNNEKEAEIQSLKEQIDQIESKFQSLPQYNEEEMNNQYKKLFIQCKNLLDLKEAKMHSLEEENLKLKSEKVDYDCNSLDEVSKLKEQIQELKKKNEENETKIKFLENQKSNSVHSNVETEPQLSKCKNEINSEKKEKNKSLESNQLDLKSHILQSNKHGQKEQLNQQTQDLDEEANIKTRNETIQNIKGEEDNKRINQIKMKNLPNQSNRMEIQTDQNLNKTPKKSEVNKTRLIKLEETVKKQNKEIRNKEKLIDKLKIIINMNQEKINRMEIEIAGLNKQLEIYHKNNEQIFDFIQSYKKQNLELIKIAFENIQKSNHSLKNEICSILLDLSEKIENNEKKSFIDELRNEIIAYNDKNDKLNESSNKKVNKLKGKVRRNIEENDENDSNSNN